jgi:hypothetical protein
MHWRPGLIGRQAGAWESSTHAGRGSTIGRIAQATARPASHPEGGESDLPNRIRQLSVASRVFLN